MLTLCAWPFHEWLCPNIQTCHLQKIDLPRKISGIELFKQENRSFSEQKCTEKVNFLPSTNKKVVQEREFIIFHPSRKSSPNQDIPAGRNLLALLVRTTKYFVLTTILLILTTFFITYMYNMAHVCNVCRACMQRNYCRPAREKSEPSV